MDTQRAKLTGYLKYVVYCVGHLFYFHKRKRLREGWWVKEGNLQSYQEILLRVQKSLWPSPQTVPWFHQARTAHQLYRTQTLYIGIHRIGDFPLLIGKKGQSHSWPYTISFCFSPCRGRGIHTKAFYNSVPPSLSLSLSTLQLLLFFNFDAYALLLSLARKFEYLYKLYGTGGKIKSINEELGILP